MLRSSSGPSGPPQQNVAEIINLLESCNVSVIEETTNLVRESLATTSDPWLLNGLIDYYITSGNVLIRRLLTGIRQPQHKNLLPKIDEYLQKPGTRYVALNLFGHIIQKDPSWIHHVIPSRAFSSVLKCLQLDNDIASLTIAMYFISTLLPKVPTRIGNHLDHLFGIYLRMVSWLVVRGVNSAGLNIENFDTALYSLFLCLYGMYPCSFIEYLQRYYCKGKSDTSKSSDAQNIRIPATTAGEEQFLMQKNRHEIFNSRVLPMLKRVRLNPNLILYAKDMEVLNDKWRKMENHDIVDEISQIPIEITSGISDSDPVPQNPSPDHSAQQSAVNPRNMDTGASRSIVEPQTDLALIWSPSMEIGLSTPPASRGISPIRDVEEKSRSDSVEKSSTRPKSRPDVLSLSQASCKSSNVSTPCTPTLPSLSFEFEKSENYLTPERNIAKNPAILTSSSASTTKNVFDFSVANMNQDSVPPSDNSTITDFSPALQPSAEHLRSPTPESAQKRTADELFIGSEKPSMHDILELATSDLKKISSASELLEKEIQFSLQNKNQTHSDIDWLHFGHGPLNEKDSQSLLAGYLQMHCALLYERHCRQQHATRARRLMRKVYEFSALEERNESLNDSLRIKESEVSQLQILVKTLQSEIVKQDKAHLDAVEIMKTKSTKLSRELSLTKEENSKLKLVKNSDTENLKKALDREKDLQSELYQCKLQLEAQTKNKETNEQLKAQLVELQKQMFLVDELRQKLEDLEEHEKKFKVAKVAEHQMIVKAYKKDAEKLKIDLVEASRGRDFFESKSKQLEKTVEKKNKLIEDQKKYLENVKSLARGQIQAIEGKYQAQKSISTAMEIKIMELFSKLTAYEGRDDIGDTAGAAGSRPIQQPRHSAPYRYSHLLDANPELSPPIKVSMMEEVTVPTSELEASTGTGEYATSSKDLPP